MKLYIRQFIGFQNTEFKHPGSNRSKQEDLGNEHICGLKFAPSVWSQAKKYKCLLCGNIYILE